MRPSMRRRPELDSTTTAAAGGHRCHTKPSPGASSADCSARSPTPSRPLLGARHLSTVSQSKTPAEQTLRARRRAPAGKTAAGRRQPRLAARARARGPKTGAGGTIRAGRTRGARAPHDASLRRPEPETTSGKNAGNRACRERGSPRRLGRELRDHPPAARRARRAPGGEKWRGVRGGRRGREGGGRGGSAGRIRTGRGEARRGAYPGNEGHEGPPCLAGRAPASKVRAKRRR